MLGLSHWDAYGHSGPTVILSPNSHFNLIKIADFRILPAISHDDVLIDILCQLCAGDPTSGAFCTSQVCPSPSLPRRGTANCRSGSARHDCGPNALNSVDKGNENPALI